MAHQLIDDRLAELDDLQVPDVWDEIELRADSASDALPVPSRRAPALLAGVAAVAVIVAGVLVTTNQLRRSAVEPPVVDTADSTERAAPAATVDSVGSPLDQHTEWPIATQTLTDLRPTWLPWRDDVSWLGDPYIDESIEPAGLGTAGAVWGTVADGQVQIIAEAHFERMTTSEAREIIETFCANPTLTFEQTDVWQGCTFPNSGLSHYAAGDYIVSIRSTEDDPVGQGQRIGLIRLEGEQVVVRGEDLLASQPDQRDGDVTQFGTRPLEIATYRLGGGSGPQALALGSWNDISTEASGGARVFSRAEAPAARRQVVVIYPGSHSVGASGAYEVDTLRRIALSVRFTAPGGQVIAPARFQGPDADGADVLPLIREPSTLPAVLDDAERVVVEFASPAGEVTSYETHVGVGPDALDALVAGWGAEGEIIRTTTRDGTAVVAQLSSVTTRVGWQAGPTTIAMIAAETDLAGVLELVGTSDLISHLAFERRFAPSDAG